MFRLHRLSSTVIALSLLASLAVAEEKKPAIGQFPFWTLPKREFADQMTPGLNAALLLTPGQISQLYDARRETIDSAELKAKVRKDPSLSDAELETMRQMAHEAHVKLRTRASNILTDDQRSLIVQVNAAYVEESQTAVEEFRDRMVSAKGNQPLQESLRRELSEHTESRFKNRLEGLLTPNQKAAWESAAAEERAAAGRPKK
jgi:hypothetical protein